MAVKIISPEETEKQSYYMQCVRDRNLSAGKRPIACIKTFGCQMNEHDSEKLAGMAERMGYELVPDEAAGKYNGRFCDLVILNTCCVRENAEEKIFGHIGALKGAKHEYPGMLTAVCGCMTEQRHISEEINNKFRNVDIVFGTHDIYRLPEFIYTALIDGRRVSIAPGSADEIAEGLPVKRESGFKAWVTVMYGCNNFCTYCVVPYVRGRERSRKKDDILHEIKMLADSGVREITLLGQNVNSYGKDIEGEVSFAGLLDEICLMIHGSSVRRVRFMTSHPKDLSDELIDVMARHSEICNQLHLPVQSGSTDVLRRMNRHYTRDQYLSLVQKIRSKIPDIALSTDIITGFPGETEQDFEDTLELVSTAQYDAAFTFIYSPRVGTPAASYENQVLSDIVHERFNRLLNVQNTICRAHNETCVGKTFDVLCEGVSRTNDKRLTGRTESNKIVNFTADGISAGKAAGRFVRVYIESAQTWSLEGRAVEWE